MIIRPLAGGPPPGPDERAALREVAGQFESLLVSELFKAMRRTVPESELGGGLGQEIFTSMLDEQLAQASAGRGGFGIAETLAEQLGAAALPASAHHTLTDGQWVSPVPVGRISPSDGQRFGAPRGGPVGAGPGRGHLGLDLGRAEGTPVVAARDGVISRVNQDLSTPGGVTVHIRHDNGEMETRYAHLAGVRPGLAVGQAIRAGERIGAVGQTGTAATGPHLHFEVRSRDRTGGFAPIDPEPYLRGWPRNEVDPAVGRGLRPVGSAQALPQSVDVQSHQVQDHTRDGGELRCRSGREEGDE